MALGPKLIAEGQRRGGNDHRNHNQRQLDDAQNQVDLGQLAGEGLAKAQALAESGEHGAPFQQGQKRRDGQWPADQRKRCEESQREKDGPDEIADQIGLAGHGDVRGSRPLHGTEPTPEA